MALSNEMIDALTYIEQVFWEDGSIPTNEKVAEVTQIALKTVEGYWKIETFRNSLKARGVSFDNTPDNKSLTFEQLMIANMLMNPADRRSLREKMKDDSVQNLGISIQQVNGWLRSPAFQEHLRKRAEVLFQGAEPSALRGMVQAIDSGDQNAIRLYFEMTGRYNPKLQVDVNIDIVLAKVTEIIVKHVSDPVILESIATDLEALEVGGPKAIPAFPMPTPAAPVQQTSRFAI